jgi:Na+/phosphate symporter
MVIPNRSEDLKVVIERLSGMCSQVESMLNFCMNGFLRHKIALLDEAKRVSQTVHDEENELMNLLSRRGTEPDANKEFIRSLMVVIGNIEMAVEGLDTVLQHVRVKTDEGILFSDKAVNEISHLFREAGDVIKTTGDTLLTKNEVLKKYLFDKCRSVNQMVDVYSEEHEKRLIQGLCQPQSSSLYLSIVNSLGKVIWHMNHAVDKFFISQ